MAFLGFFVSDSLVLSSSGSCFDFALFLDGERNNLLTLFGLLFFVERERVDFGADLEEVFG